MVVRDWCFDSRAVYPKRQNYTRHPPAQPTILNTARQPLHLNDPSREIGIFKLSRHLPGYDMSSFFHVTRSLSLFGNHISRSQLPRGCASTTPRVQAREIDNVSDLPHEIPRRRPIASRSCVSSTLHIPALRPLVHTFGGQEPVNCCRTPRVCLGINLTSMNPISTTTRADDSRTLGSRADLRTCSRFSDNQVLNDALILRYRQRRCKPAPHCHRDDRESSRQVPTQGLVFLFRRLHDRGDGSQALVPHHRAGRLCGEHC